VELSDFPSKSLLAKDLFAYSSSTGNKPVVAMEMKFPKDYPMSPPFVRILRPRFKFLTGMGECLPVWVIVFCSHGDRWSCAGHVTIGGSICMQLLTRSGWSPTNDIEASVALVSMLDLYFYYHVCLLPPLYIL